jgi:hypothetical protein
LSPRARLLLTSGAFAVLLVVVYADPLWTGRNFVGRDLIAYNLPMEKTIHDAYSRGRFPVWSPEISGGRPLLPNPNAGALYPVRMLLAAASFPSAMRLFPILHWLAAGVGTLLLLMNLGVSMPGAWLGAVTYVFSGVVVSEIFFPHYLPGMTLLPWILWTIHRPFRSEGARVVLLASLFALDLYAAEVFTILLGVAAALLWILFETERVDRTSRFSCLVAALLMGAVAAAPQILASALWVGETRRAVSGLTIGEVTSYSLSPARLLELVVPYLFGATWKLERSAVWTTAVYRDHPIGLFSTIFCGVLGLIAVAELRRQRIRGARFGKAFLALGVLASVLPGLIPKRLWTMTAPLALRNPEKFAVAIVFALSILSALFVGDFRTRGRPSRAWLWAGVALSAIAIASFLAPWTAGRVATSLWRGDIAAAAAEIPRSLVEAALLWMVTVAAVELLREPGRARRSAGVALLTFVPIFATRKIPELAQPDDAFAPTAFARMQQKKDPEGSFRALGESIYRPLPPGLTEPGLGWAPSPARSWIEHSQALWGRGTVFNDDFDSGDLFRMEQLRVLSARAATYRDSGDFFGSVALRWGVRFRGQDSVAGYHAIGADGMCEWDEHEHAFHAIRLLEEWREEPTTSEALRAIPSLPAGSVVLETGKRSPGHSRGGEVRVFEQSADRLSLETQTSEPGWLFILREFWKWRRILVDGKEVAAIPAQLAFSAIRVPAGIHQIEWTEEIPGFTVSRWGPPLFVGLALVICLASRSRSAR